MSHPLLVECYRRLPARRDEDNDAWLVRFHAAVAGFRKQVSERYSEGTLQRLLTRRDPETRQSAVLALGLLGSLSSNRALTKRLRDPDERVRELASGALWSIWFRGDDEDCSQELQRLVRLKDRGKALAGLDALISRAPTFAEAYNQRAILYWQMRCLEKSATDCKRVLRLNPCHFGAQVGLAQRLLQQGRQRAALRAFRATLRLHPAMQGVADTIRALEEALDDGGRDGKK